MSGYISVIGERFHYGMAAGVVITDLWPHLKNGECIETLRKAKNIGLVIFCSTFTQALVSRA